MLLSELRSRRAIKHIPAVCHARRASAIRHVNYSWHGLQPRREYTGATGIECGKSTRCSPAMLLSHLGALIFLCCNWLLHACRRGAMLRVGPSLKHAWGQACCCGVTLGMLFDYSLLHLGSARLQIQERSLESIFRRPRIVGRYAGPVASNRPKANQVGRRQAGKMGVR